MSPTRYEPKKQKSNSPLKHRLKSALPSSLTFFIVQIHIVLVLIVHIHFILISGGLLAHNAFSTFLRWRTHCHIRSVRPGQCDIYTNRMDEWLGTADITRPDASSVRRGQWVSYTNWGYVQGFSVLFPKRKLLDAIV